MYAGYWITLADAKRFVTPASLADNIAAMVRNLSDTDPQDEFCIRVEWGNSFERPMYTTEG